MAQKRNISDDLDYKVAKERKIWPIFIKAQTPHKIWHHAKKGQMENVISRFPQLFGEILGLLDNQTLVKCNKVDKSWYNAVTKQRIYWTQMIINYTNSRKEYILEGVPLKQREEYHKQWMKAIDKTPIEILKKLAELARDNCGHLKGRQKRHIHKCDFFCNDEEDYTDPELSLFNILASEDDIDLFKYVAGKVGYKHTFGTRNDKQCIYKYSPLHEAASRGHFEICKFIIDQVDDKNPANEKGHTPFHAAANYRPKESRYAWTMDHPVWKGLFIYNHPDNEIEGHFEICQLIFERNGFQNPADYCGETPLHSAASHGNVKICQMIIEKVDDPNPSTKYGRDTPLHSAAGHGFFQICKLIVEKAVNKNPKNMSGETPLHRAAGNGHFEICQLIIGGIAEKNPREDYDGNTPLHYAATNKHWDICKLIIGKIDEKNPRNDNGTTPLHHAAKKSNLEICQLIIEGVKEKNPSNDYGTTPLHHAAQNGNLEICKLILSQNIEDKNPKNKKGRTPLDIAYDKKDLRILYLLIGENNLQF